MHLLCVSLFLFSDLLADTTSNLRAHWPLTVNTQDSSPNANHGTPGGAPVFQLLAGRNCLLFDGGNDYVEVPNSPTLGGYGSAFTFSVWVYPQGEVGSHPRRIFEKGNNSEVRFLLDAHRPSVDGFGLTPSSSVCQAIPVGQWSHVTVTYDGAVMRYYRNGSLRSSVNSTGTAALGSGELRIGNHPSMPERGFLGGMADLRIYGRALSSTDVAELYVSDLGSDSTLLNTHRAFLDSTTQQRFSAADVYTPGSGPMTWEAWIRTRQSGIVGTILDLGDTGPYNSVKTRILENGHLQSVVGWNAGGSRGFVGHFTESASVVNDGEWHHIAAVFENVNGRAKVVQYIDGNFEGEATDPGYSYNLTSMGHGLNIGVQKQWADASVVLPFDGDIDEVRIWSVARPQSEIRASMFSEIVGGQPGMRGYWRFNGSLLDESGNGKTLVAINGAAMVGYDLPFSRVTHPLPFVPDEDTLLLLHLDQAVVDSSRNPVTAVPGGSTGFGVGKLAYGITQTAGSSGRNIDLGTPPKLDLTAGPFTVSGWFRTSQNLAVPNQNMVIFVSTQTSPPWSAYALDMLMDGAANNGKVRLLYTAGSGSSFTVTSAESFNDGNWHWAAGAVDGAGRMRLFVDGVERGISVTASGTIATGKKAVVGSNWDLLASGVWVGDLDEVMVSRRSLSGEEIRKYFGGIVRTRHAAAPGSVVLRKSDASWNAARAALSGDEARNSDPQYIATDKEATAYNLFIPFMAFDTSNLPATGTDLTGGSLNFHYQPDVAGNDFTAVVQTSQSIWNLPGVDDFDQRGSVEGSERLSSKTASAVNSWPLNAAGLEFVARSGERKPATASAVGKTQLGLRWGADLSQVAPTSRDYARLSMPGSSNPPFLFVEHRASSAQGMSGSISGTVSGSSGAGTLRVRASRAGVTYWSVGAGDGDYALVDLPLGGGYFIYAFEDGNENGAADLNERFGIYSQNPVAVEATGRTEVNIALLPPDTDNDGILDAWELAVGMTVGINDAHLDLDGDGLTNLQEFQLFDIALLAAKFPDLDGDGIDDGDEYLIYGTNPLLADSDSDGMPDKWEIDNGLDPLRDDALEDRDFDFVSNLDEYNGGVNSTNPSSGFTSGTGVSDYGLRYPGQSRMVTIYDRNNRLLGVRDSRGASFSHVYDGNGNPIRHVNSEFDSDGDGLSDIWEIANGLDHLSPDGPDGAYGDPDGDGWTNLQEQAAGTRPRSSASRPGVNGDVVGSHLAGFDPRKFVVASGQMDNSGAAEIVVAADGDSGGEENFVSVLTERSGIWEVETVNVGHYGVTSLAVGVIGTRAPAIYAGLRQVGGKGRLVELKRDRSGWTLEPIAESESDSAHVVGLRSVAGVSDLIVNFSPFHGPSTGLYRIAHTSDAWRSNLLNALPSLPESGSPLAATSLGVGYIEKASNGGNDRVFRLLDAGGVQTSVAKSYPTLDEFEGNTVNTNLWTMELPTPQQGSGNSISQSGGTVQLNVNWTPSNGPGAIASLVTNLQWPENSHGLVISIPSLGHSRIQGDGGGAYVQIGSTTIFSVGVGSSATDVLLNLFRFNSRIYTRIKLGDGVWSDWSDCPESTTLRFVATGNRIDSSGGNAARNAHLYVDFIRYTSIGALITAGASPSDFSTALAAYRAASNSWVFATPSSLTRLEAEQFAFNRGGVVASIDSLAQSSWIQGKFPGDHWIGLNRASISNPWKWSGGSTVTLAPLPWSAGQPLAESDQRFASTNAGVWFSANGSESKTALVDIQPGSTEVSATSVVEPMIPNRLRWSGQTLSGGRFTSTSPEEASVISAHYLDNDTSGTVSAGDEFVLIEPSPDGTAGQYQTFHRETLSGATLSQSFGMAAARTRAGTSDLLMTGDSNGEVRAWTRGSSGSEAPLEPKLISTEHRGKAWQGMARVEMGVGTDGVVGLRVSPDQPRKVDLVFWSPDEIGFSAPPVIRETLPWARLTLSPSSGESSANVGVRTWDGEGNPVSLELQFLDPSVAAVWNPATLLMVGGQPAASNPKVSAPPSGATHTMVWNALSDLGPAFEGNVRLRVRASDASGSGAWSEEIVYAVDTTYDTDLDGLPDDWERLHFSDLDEDGDDDTDGDGVPNRIEFADGTNPASASSAKYRLQIQSIHGSATRTPDLEAYDRGTGPGLTAISEEEYGFVGWRRLGDYGDDFVLRATASLVVPSTGVRTFAVHRADGARLSINGVPVIDQESHSTGSENFGEISLAPGTHNLELIAFDRSGPEAIELYAASGSHSSFGPDFRLVGDTINGGLEVRTTSGGSPVPGFTVLQVASFASRPINSFAAAGQLLSGAFPARARAERIEAVVNYSGGMASGDRFSGNLAFPLRRVETSSPLDFTMWSDTVLLSLNSISLDEALDTDSTGFRASGESPWLGELSASASDGVDHLFSGPLSDGEEATLSVEILGPGDVTFKWKVSSQEGADVLEFLVNGVVDQSISGEQPYAAVTRELPVGLNTLTWRYRKDGAGSAGQDRAWLDQLAFTETRYPLMITGQGGTVGADPVRTDYRHGDVVTLTAAPGTDNTFAGWSGDLGGSANPAQVTMDGAKSIEAIFHAPLGSALEATALPWTTGGSQSWSGRFGDSRQGDSAARSGSLADGQESWLETELVGPGTLTFWWKVSSETGADFLRLLVDGAAPGSVSPISGEVAWRQETITLPQGTHAVRWSYLKNGSGSDGADAAWVDEVIWSPDGGTSPTRHRLEFSAFGGTVTANPAQADYGAGQWVELTAVPNAGNGFHSWGRDASGSSNPVTVLMDRARSVDALFTRPLGTALGSTALSWSSGGSSPWYGLIGVPLQGDLPARSGGIGHNQSSRLTTSMLGKGTLRFKWRVSSEQGGDYLRFLVNGSEIPEVPAITGEIDWTPEEVVLNGPSSSIEWEFAKNASIDGGIDAGWVKDVEWIPIPPAPRITIQHPPGRDVAATGSTVNFGSVKLRKRSKARVFLIQNTGDAPLAGVAVSLAGRHNREFRVSTPGRTLAPGGVTAFSSIFTPKAKGTRRATLIIRSNAANASAAAVRMIGKGR